MNAGRRSAMRTQRFSAPAPALARSVLTYTQQQEAKGRPISPHVFIYKWPITAIASITNRATGVALYGTCVGIAGLSLIGANVPAMMTVIGNYGLVGCGAKCAVAFPVIYHVRHVVLAKCGFAVCFF
jgi:succinate dehydrogenase (ubiquinone) cytochrome b560 subunit